MKSIDIIAVGKSRNTSFEPLIADYQKRILWPTKIHEIESKHKQSAKITADEHAQISGQLDSSTYIIALDERGKTLKSLEFAAQIQDLQNAGRNKIQFILGGADGLSDPIRSRAGLLLSFGKQTWPHMLARVMLLEQIYRVQQILAGHPYHRE